MLDVWQNILCHVGKIYLKNVYMLSKYHYNTFIKHDCIAKFVVYYPTIPPGMPVKHLLISSRVPESEINDLIAKYRLAALTFTTYNYKNLLFVKNIFITGTTLKIKTPNCHNLRMRTLTKTSSCVYGDSVIKMLNVDCGIDTDIPFIDTITIQYPHEDDIMTVKTRELRLHSWRSAYWGLCMKTQILTIMDTRAYIDVFDIVDLFVKNRDLELVYIKCLPRTLSNSYIIQCTVNVQVTLLGEYYMYKRVK